MTHNGTRTDGRKPNLRPSRVLLLSAVAAAWIGAMIEAEGSVTISPLSSRHLLRISVVNSDPEIISVLLRHIGTGSVSTKHGANKLCYVWSVQRQREVQEIARQCQQYSMKLQKVGV